MNPDQIGQTNLSPGRRLAVLGLVALGYFGFAAAATYPVIRTAGSAVPGHLSDPLEHLWIMRWSAACLAEGRSPYFCPDLQYPVGVPLGLFPTMHLQTAGYLAMGLLTSNDVLRFNALWAFGFVSTGVAGFVLAWSAVRRFWPAWLGGLGLMLCGPMMMHAHGHLETMQMGAVPLFLLAWLRFVDRPGWRGLLVAAGLYLLVVASAPYFAVLATVPAIWAVSWGFGGESKSERWGWIRARLGWLAGFGLATLPGVMVLFSSQIWAIAHGYAMSRSRSEFNRFGAPAWSYLAPTPWHRLGGLLPADLYAASGFRSRIYECCSYPGVVALALLGYAVAGRVRFDRRGYWWSSLALVVVLSWGAYGPSGIWLPAGWLYEIFPPFRLIRVPARFNLFAAAVAVVPAAAALRDLLGRVGSRGGRAAIVAAVATLMAFDLAIVPFPTATIPALPAIYREVVRDHPGAAILDAPVFASNQGNVLGSLCGYWQSLHRGRTSAGYSGVANTPFDAEIVEACPWSARLMALGGDAPPGFGPISGGDPRDQAWLFLAAHRYDYLFLHQGPTVPPHYLARVAVWKDLLAPARIAESGDVAVFDRARLPAPASPAATIGRGWKRGKAGSAAGKSVYAVRQTAGITVYQPEPGGPARLELQGIDVRGRGRRLRMLDRDGRELAASDLGPGRAPGPVVLTFALPAGLQTLRLESDGEDRPTRPADVIDEARTPYSFLVRSIELGANPPPDAEKVQGRPDDGR
ncbi:hypothetical protein TA3x_004988 [Tundrisphaera sp. TA3]|uniref:hypothetical protein n=1 Tax=Tundrisphaera sp. TA3 TaxID=3435775 RepID=UPI003EBE9525